MEYHVPQNIQSKIINWINNEFKKQEQDINFYVNLSTIVNKDNLDIFWFYQGKRIEQTWCFDRQSSWSKLDFLLNEFPEYKLVINTNYGEGTNDNPPRYHLVFKKVSKFDDKKTHLYDSTEKVFFEGLFNRKSMF
jgi:hypothetical protein